MDITGISNEPWHYRYVGTTVAKIMKEENLCLEEYLENRGRQICEWNTKLILC